MNGKILIVDDSPADVLFIKKIMKNTLFKFDSVGLIQACKKYLEEEVPMAIILDYHLPDGDSLEIVDQYHSKIPIVLLTGMEDPNIGLLAVKKGAQDFLIKGNINSDLVEKSINYSIERQSLKTRVASTEKMATLGRMSSGIAHEMNTPIQYVSDNFYFLENEFSSVLSKLEKVCADSKSMNDTEFHESFKKEFASVDLNFLSTEIPDAVKQSLQGMEKLSKLVRALKNFAVNETSQTKKVDINKVITSMVSGINLNYEQVFKVQFNAGEELQTVLLEERNLKQVISNILDNSIYELKKKYKKSQEIGLIEINTFQKENVLEVRISDNGDGIPEDIIGHVFDPFFTTKSFEGSLGQGLAIAHRLVHEVFGGTLKVNSQQNSGAEFVIVIPIGKFA